MAKKNENSSLEQEKQESYTVNQICNKMCLNGLIRNFIEERFKDEVATEEEWLQILKNKGINF